MESCQRTGKFFGGCRFEPRFNIHSNEANAVTVQQIEALDGALFEEENVLAAIEALASGGSTKTYVGDVCVRCGKRAEDT